MKKIIALVLSLFLSQSVFALDYQDVSVEGIEPFVDNEYKTTFKIYKDLSEQGNSRAQNILAKMYVKGNGIEQDYQQAKLWFGKSCDNGYLDACYELRKLNEKITTYYP